MSKKKILEWFYKHGFEVYFGFREDYSIYCGFKTNDNKYPYFGCGIGFGDGYSFNEAFENMLLTYSEKEFTIQYKKFVFPKYAKRRN